MYSPLQFLKYIKVRRVENRPEDAWYDMSLRQLRTGEVSFYRVKDFLTGDWLLKICKDKEQGKFLVKAVKCPAGVRFSQLEGKTMVFQDSIIEGMLYDIISLSEADENDRLRRNIVSSIEEIPAVIKENYTIKPYEEATGKKAPGKHLVTLSKQENEKELITLFILERAKTTKKEVGTGQVLSCPICGKKHRLVHVETEKTVKHRLQTSSEQPEPVS